MAGLASLASKCRIESCLSSQNSSSFPFLSASGHGSFCKHSSLRLLETAYSLFVGGGGGVGSGGKRGSYAWNMQRPEIKLKPQKQPEPQ